MSTDNNRADTARDNDDSDIIDRMEDAPSQGSASGHNISRDIGTRDEVKQEVGDGTVTRVRDSDKPEEADRPGYDPGKPMDN